MAEQQTEVGPTYYDGWQKQLADLRAENERLSAEVERMRGHIETSLAALDLTDSQCQSALVPKRELRRAMERNNGNGLG